MAVCPNPEYEKYIRTTGGLTLEEPTGLIATGFDYGEWYALAGKMRYRMEQDWRQVLEGAEKSGASDWAVRIKPLQDEVQAIRTRHNNLLEPWDFWDFTQIGTQISDITAVVHDLVCTWQHVNEQAPLFGVTITEKPHVIGEKPGLGIVGTTLLVVGGAGVAFGLGMLAWKIGNRP